MGDGRQPDFGNQPDQASGGAAHLDHGADGLGVHRGVIFGVSLPGRTEFECERAEGEADNVERSLEAVLGTESSSGTGQRGGVGYLQAGSAACRGSGAMRRLPLFLLWQP